MKDLLLLGSKAGDGATLMENKVEGTKEQAILGYMIHGCPLEGMMTQIVKWKRCRCLLLNNRLSVRRVCLLK